MTRIAGLTGGIGSGKSTVARMLEKLGATVIDADAIAHELLAPGTPLIGEVAAAFGPELIDASGALDRDALGTIVFRDPGARRRLERIVHPEVGAEVARRLAEARRGRTPLVVLDIPLLFEAHEAGSAGGFAAPFDATIVVWVPRRIQIQRQLDREGYGRDEAERRLEAQMPLDEKKRLADFVIDNSGSFEETERQVRQLYAQLTAAT